VSDPTEIDDLTTRKRLLAAECESHRRALAREFNQLQSSAAALAQPVRSVLSVSSLLVLAAPLAGFVLGRRKGRSRNWLKMGLLGWQLLRRFQPLWGQFRKRCQDSGR
jgi:hypothetical protein